VSNYKVFLNSFSPVLGFSSLEELEVRYIDIDRGIKKTKVNLG